MASLITGDDIISDVNPARVLVVGPPQILKLVQGALAGHGEFFRLDVCDGLQAALERVRADDYDLALLALNLPDSWAADTYKRFLAEEPENLPVLLLGTSAEARLAAQGVPSPPFAVLDPDDVDPLLLRRLITSASLFRRAGGKRAGG